jgi:S-adenosylmethionine:tRNA ribosyltransferase-isomerase
MKTSDFDFHLPRELIAQRPCEKRGGSRLMALTPDGGVVHKTFADIVEFLHPGDMLVLNDTRVVPARLVGRTEDGGALDMLVVGRADDVSADDDDPGGQGGPGGPGGPARYKILSRGKFTGRVVFGEGRAGLEGFYADVTDGAEATFHHEGALEERLEETGLMPLPPYIKRAPDAGDKERYQSVYARFNGSIAAPTAGLHFTQALLDAVRARGVLLDTVTLHVGTGTFKPVRAEFVANHRMDEERFVLKNSTLEAIQRTKSSGGRVTLVGTTTTRCIEGYLSGRYRALNIFPDRVEAVTDVFIHPGFKFRAADAVLTNFHLPRSTPLMLTSALCGRLRLLEAYARAVAAGYSFFSYGDAILVPYENGGFR